MTAAAPGVPQLRDARLGAAIASGCAWEIARTPAGDCLVAAMVDGAAVYAQLGAGRQIAAILEEGALVVTTRGLARLRAGAALTPDTWIHVAAALPGRRTA